MSTSPNMPDATAPRCRLVTLGCKVNQYETQHVKEALETHGWAEARDGEPADLCVVNTCTVTMEGDAKSRQWIRRLHKQNPQARVVVMGCYATRDPDAVGRLPGVSKVIVDKAKLADELAEFGVARMPDGITRFDGHQRAFVKVQDGCLLNCSYCIIPSVRPIIRSREPEAIVDEVNELVAGGCPEVVLTGIHLGHYGIDLSKGRPKSEWRRLWHLLDRLDRLPGDFRVRLSSLEAAEARDDLIEAMARSRRVVPHLHLCLQSGSDHVLERMKRRYRSAGFVERCRRIRASLDHPAFTTDIIIGFPGETETDFQATMDVARAVGFAKTHLFSYSPREGTPAATFGHAVSPQVMEERRQRLVALERELADQYRRSLLGREVTVLVEGDDPQRPGRVTGTTCRYVQASLRGYAPALLRKLVPIRIEAVEGDMLLGEPLVEPQGLPDPHAANGITRNRRISLPIAS
ncbi:MAG: tRNA (N(6)-L-threonylcarbamoyladenosine(37)-C(2))-methylthiotransferase MtaB [Gemmataceae bacterium]